MMILKFGSGHQYMSILKVKSGVYVTNDLALDFFYMTPNGTVDVTQTIAHGLIVDQEVTIRWVYDA